MYQAHFGLSAAPFSITPDPQYLYLSEPHREALAHLLYGVNESPGFVLLTGEVGTGKTTLCRCLIEQLPENVDVALLLNPRLSPLELLATIFDELRIHYDVAFTLKDFIDTLNTYLLTAHTVGRRTVVILDEAQNLAPEVLEQLRLLTNLETTQQKLLQIILVGQPELQKLLKRENLRQLSQRITARYHLLPLSSRDTQAYINHRLAISGAREPLFTRGAMRKVFRESGGIPRLINIICDRALLGGYVNNRRAIDTGIVRRAVREVMGITTGHNVFLQDWLYATLSVVFAGVLLVSSGFWLLSPQAQQFFANNPFVTHAVTLPTESESIPLTVEPRPNDLPIATGEEVGVEDIAALDDTAFQAVEEPEPGVISADAVGNEDSNTAASTAGDETTDTATTEPALDETETAETSALPVENSTALKKLLSSDTVQSDTNSAFGTLFGLWSETYQAKQNVTACEYAASVGLACLYKTGSWADLRLYNRPAVIELITDNGEQHHVVVTALSENTAILDFAGQRHQFDLKSINNYWLGQLLLFWQPAAMPIPIVQAGTKGENIQWLRKRLAAVQGESLENVSLSPRFDNDLRAQLMAFQKKNGLQVDGVAGEETQLMLDALAKLPPVLATP